MHARNADEHGIDPIAREEPGGVGLNPREGNILHIDSLQVSRNKVTMGPILAKNVRITFIPSKVTLTEVRDRGKIYPVPAEHLDAPISDPSPLYLAEQALAFWHGKIEEAERWSNVSGPRP
jgi:hypothetical protein